MQSPSPADDPLIAAFFGNRRRGRRFDIEAALIPFWMAWRELPLLQIGSLLVFLVLWLSLTFTIDSNPVRTLLATWLFMALVTGLAASSLLEGRARRVRARVEKRGLQGEEALEAMRRGGRPSWVSLLGFGALGGWAGWTLLIALSSGGGGHQRGALATMKSDLRNLVTAQESYFLDNANFSSNPDSMHYTSASSVTVTLGPVTATGWSATAKHSMVPNICGIWVGTATPPIADGVEGEPKCVPNR